jgi:hypothetical protein
MLREHPLVNNWRKKSARSKVCVDTENTDSAIPGILLEPTVPGLVIRVAATMSSSLNPSVMINMYDHIRPKF